MYLGEDIQENDACDIPFEEYVEADDRLLPYAVQKIVLKTRIQKLVLRRGGGGQQCVNQFLSVVKQYSVSVCTTTFLVVFLMFQSGSSETGKFYFKFFERQVKQMTL
jgi:hypothetical protein